MFGLRHATNISSGTVVIGVVSILAAVIVARPALGREGPQPERLEPELFEPQTLFQHGTGAREIPALHAGRRHGRAPGDTLFYGYYNGVTGLAISGHPRGGAAHTWTFDHGASLPFEGWYATDLTANVSASFRHITPAIWAGHDNAVSAPILAGGGSAWIGNWQDEADDLCWTAGLGYGNSWCQRLVSPPIAYAGGGATLQFEYFNDTEAEFDYTRILLRRPDGDEVSLNFDGFTDQIGLAANHPAGIPVGANFVAPVGDVEVGPFATFQLIFEMESDGSWADQDGGYATEYGAFAADDVSLTGGAVASYTFEANLQGWTPSVCSGVGSFFGVQDVAVYTIQDPSDCELAGNVLEFHDDSFEHPSGQRVLARSNPIDLTSAHAQYGDALAIGAYWDQYSELPVANGVLYRPGWMYYPFLCPVTGETIWSPRAGQGPFNFTGNDPLCTTILAVATTNGIPDDVDQVRFIYEIYASCDAFGIPPSNCSGSTNFTPVIDNLNVFATQNSADTPQALLYQVDWSGDLDTPVPFSQFGDLVYRIEPGDPPRFLNLLLRSNDGTLEDWAVQNLPLYQGPHLTQPLDLRVFFDLEPLGIDEGEQVDSLDYALSLDSTFLVSPPLSPTYETSAVASSEFDAGGGVDSSGTAGSSLERRFYWPGGPPHPPVITAGESRYGEVPNVDESRNACGPGSVTRNILYLAQAEPACVHLDPTIDTGPELIAKMKTFMNHDPNNGVTHDNFLRGKTRLSDAHPELNIYTKFQAPTQRVDGNDYHDDGSKTSALREGTTPDWDWIKSEIDAGEVVEMWVHWLSPSGARTKKGHLVSILDYWENPEIGQRGLHIQHDEGQGNDDGKNEVRSLQWFDAGEEGGEQDHPTVRPFRRNVVDMVVSQSPQVKPIVDPNDCTVRWDTQHPTYQPKTVKIKPGATVRVPGLKQSHKSWTHPKYEEFVWTNDTEATKTWKLFVPDDSRISGGQFQRERTVDPRHAQGAAGVDGRSGRARGIDLHSRGANAIDSDLVILTMHFDGSGWVLDPWDDSGLTEEVRFPMIGTDSGSGTVYAVVDFELYVSSNPLGPAGGGWDIDTTLESLDLDIVGGVSAGISGIWFATAPIEFDGTLTPPFLPETGPAGWLDRSSFEASFGPLSVVQEVQIGVGVSTTPTSPAVPRYAAVRAFPNPFVDRTVVSFDLPAPGDVTLSVFDVQGRRIDVLANRHFEAGTHLVDWADRSLDQLPLGNYFIRLQAPGEVVTTKISRIR